MSYVPTSDRYILPGSTVRLKSVEGGNSEYGVIIHCWKDDEIDGFACYVAVIGAKPPTGKLAEKPFVVRCAASSLDQRSYSEMHPKEVYGAFLSGLAGLVDDAGIEGFSSEGLQHLRAAQKSFREEFRDRHESR